jgi:hypothetical protein
VKRTAALVSGEISAMPSIASQDLQSDGTPIYPVSFGKYPVFIIGL